MGAPETVENSVQKTKDIIKEVMYELGWDDERNAFLALKSVLKALRNRLPVNEAAELGAQLPAVLRGYYYEGWVPSKKPEKLKLQEFVENIHMDFNYQSAVDPEFVAKAVFTVLNRRISEGEMEDVLTNLPKNFRSFISGPKEAGWDSYEQARFVKD